MNIVDDTTQTVEKTAADICRIAADILGVPVLSAQRIGGSGNNRVYFLSDHNSRPYVVKFYFRHPSDKRDRLGAEFDSLSFLWKQGIRQIPRPFLVNREESCAIYEFIEGKKIVPAEITDKDIEYAVKFLGQLKGLNKIARSENMPSASDACFSIKAIIANIEGRLSRFTQLKEQTEEYAPLESFLDDHFKPLLGELKLWAEQQCRDSNISFDEEITLEQKTLSPSDFGFHNAIRCADGRIVFLDFEYFGWDDPAKTVVDFLFHPAMALSEPMKKAFVQRMLETFKENQQLTQRVKLVYPLFGLKWCTIFLNEFIPNDFSRRAFASANPLDRSQVRQAQLLKAKNLFQQIQETYLKFPYAS